MYFTFLVGGNDFESFINFGFSLVPMLYSSISDLTGSLIGFLGTSFDSNKSSKGVNPLGKKLSLRLITLVSSLIILSISSCSKFSTSDLVNLVGLNQTLLNYGFAYCVFWGLLQAWFLRKYSVFLQWFLYNNLI